MTRRIASLAAAGLLSVAASGAAANAQTPPPGGDERPTVRLGPFELRPRLVLNNIGIDNNVFNERDNPKEDYTFAVHPDLDVTVQPGPFKLTWLSGTEYVWYRRYESERMVNRTSTINADVDLRLVRPFVSFTISDTSARPSPEIDARARHRPRTVSAGATLKLATRTTFTAQWNEGREEYDRSERFRGVRLADTLNRKSTGVSGALALQLTPLTAFSIAAGRDELRFEQAPLRNSTSTHVSPTLTFSPVGPISGSAAVGYKKIEGADPALPEYRGLAMNGAVTVLLGARYRLETRFVRDVQYSYEKSLPYYVLTGARGTLATQLNNLLDVRVTGGQDQMRYRAYGDGESPGSDRQFVYGGGIGFRIGDRKRFVIQTEWTERRSDRDVHRGFKNHRIFGTLTFGA